MQIAKSGLLCQICVQKVKEIGCFLLEPQTQNIRCSIQQIVRTTRKQTGVHDICSTPQRVAFYKSNQYLIKTQGHRLTRKWIFSSVGLFIGDDTFNFRETESCYWRKGTCRIYAPFLKVAPLQKPCIFLFFQAWPCTEGCLVLGVLCIFH